MNRNTFLIFIFFFISTTLLAQKNNTEFRASWVVTWEYISPASSIEENKARIRKILDEHKAANMTSVLWQVRQSGTAYYNSSYEPWGSYAGSSFPGFDPFAYAVEEAHKRGLEIHAWFNVFAAASTVSGAPAREHPEWICRDKYGNPMTDHMALSPGMQAVRNYLIKVAMEVVNKYDIDGLHLDYIRWNEYTNSTVSKQFAKLQSEQKLLDGQITGEQIEELNINAANRYLYDAEHPYSEGVPGGFNSWEDWWRSSVTEFVKTLHDTIQAVKPWVRLSAAALGKYNWSSWQGYGSVFQDAALWFNEGYIEQLTPMHYHWTTGTGFLSMLVNGCPECWGSFIQKGISEGRFFSVGPPSYQLDENNIWDNHIEIVNACRTVSWVDGFQFFSYGSWESHHYWQTAAKVFFQMKTKIRSINQTNYIIPDAPNINITKIDSLNYQISVTPPSTINENQWFAVYRSPTEKINTDSTEIIGIYFNDKNFTIDQQFNGYQDFNGKYQYVATMLDRFWNESLISNMVATDTLPSFAPTIKSSVPAQNQIININSPVQINFSKTMDVNRFINSFSITPFVLVKNFTWSDDNTTLSIHFLDNLLYDTAYSLKINSLAHDINGRTLDGNGDGIEGDDFILNFRTVEKDITGPVVIHSYPQGNGEVNNFDVDDIIRIVFDETVESSLMNDNNVVLSDNGTTIEKNIFYSAETGKTILCIKPLNFFIPSRNYQLTIDNLTDLSGNKMTEEYSTSFTTNNLNYKSINGIDNFSTEGYWKQPEYSGSTRGIVDSGTYFGYDYNFYLPGINVNQSAYISYQWDPSSSDRLLREYLYEGPPRDVVFDTSYILQVYIWGDSSLNKFRFALDEGDGTNWLNHEVSTWMPIDWYGWKLIEWNLSDPSTVGKWIGNGVLDFPLYRTDSFQLTDVKDSKQSGEIYFSDLRIAKKNSDITHIAQLRHASPKDFKLYQNYPNPFNPETVISFLIPKSGLVILEVFDILGRKVSTVNNRWMQAGFHTIRYNVLELASGIYFYRVTFNGKSLTKTMIFLK